MYVDPYLLFPVCILSLILCFRYYSLFFLLFIVGDLLVWPEVWPQREILEELRGLYDGVEKNLTDDSRKWDLDDLHGRISEDYEA